jgi:hypothetical protein
MSGMDDQEISNMAEVDDLLSSEAYKELIGA